MQYFWDRCYSGFTAALRIEQIATMPMISFGVAVSVFVAQNFGAKNISRVRQGVIKTSIINLLLSLVMALVMRHWGSGIVGLFIGSEKTSVIKIAARLFICKHNILLFLRPDFHFQKRCFKG